MMNIQDLDIERELLPLVDFTHNEYAKQVLTNLLKKTLPTTEDILQRQAILKGFIANYPVLKDFSYSKIYLLEVHSFLLNFPVQEELAGNRLKIQLLFSEKERHQRSGKLIQLVLLFHKFQTYYISRINTKSFPDTYKKQLLSLNDFFSSFRLNHYEYLIREHKFRIKHIVELTRIIQEKAKAGEFVLFWEQLFLFEAYLSLSLGILKHGFVFPEITKGAFSLQHFYHPILKEPVKNSFTTNGPVVLLTGPNMSGKSTCLKAISLCVLMGHLGLAVPAQKAEMPYFDSISISINLKDDIISGYSHFMTEVNNLKKVVQTAENNGKCFAVFDELFRGTNSEDAVAISTTTIKGLSKFDGSFFFISTHLHQLKYIKETKSEKIATYYIDCELADSTPTFTYKLKQGWSDLKIGQLLFEKEGLNKLLSHE